MKKVIIIGAGPAGLTAGYELLKNSSDFDVTIVEESSNVGGLCSKFVHNDKVLDAGGHMFISNNSQVKEFWKSFLPTQGVPSCDDLFLDRYCKISNGGPDPETVDNVMLSREKITRVYSDGKFYESPFRLNKDNFKNFGLGNSIKSSFSQLGGTMFKKKEKSLEEYYVNRYGSKLYDMFLDSYTEKVMGRNPGKISAAFGPVSERDVITPNISVDKNDGRDLEKATPPFANRFYYPKKGVSQLWENVADRFIEKGGSIHKNCKVQKIHTEDGIITGITCDADGELFFVACDYLISSMPVKDFVNGLSEVPFNVTEVVHGLSYRGLVTIGVELLDMGIKNDTYEKTVNNIIPDSFLYVNENDVKLGRIQVYNNFSPYMVGKDNHIWLGLNYYCNEGDYYWSLNEDAWKKLAVSDLKSLGIIRDSEEILDYKKVSFSKAFPCYCDTFERFEEVKTFLDTFDNLYCIGRNGQHNFLTMEQTMLTSFEAVKCILNKSKDKSSIWNASEIQEFAEEGKVNSALLAQNVEYRGNAIPLQRTDTLGPEGLREPSKEPISIKRMRRPMMTPIKKAEPKLDENGQVVEGSVVFNDYNLIGAPSFRRAPLVIEEVKVEEENESASFENADENNALNDNSLETSETKLEKEPDINDIIAEIKENEKLAQSKEKTEDPVILKNSVIIAQRPERTIPFDVPEEELNAEADVNVKEAEIEDTINPDTLTVQTEAVSVSVETAYNETVSDNNSSQNSSFGIKNDNPYAYLWSQPTTVASQNDVHEVSDDEIKPLNSSNSFDDFSATDEKIEEIQPISEEIIDANSNSEESSEASDMASAYEVTPKENDQASFDYYMEHMFDDMPEGNISFKKADTFEKPKIEEPKEPAKIVKSGSFDFVKVDKFVEKDSNIENLKVIEKSNSSDSDNSDIFGKVESFEEKEMLEDTERVVKSHHYVDLSSFSDNIFNKAESFNENVLLSETETVIPRPVYDSSEVNTDLSQNENVIDNEVEEDNRDIAIDNTEVEYTDKKTDVLTNVSSFSPFSTITSEIDPSIVFKNAKVIKSTKVARKESEEKSVIRKSWLNNISELGGKEKVIAKYVNGEQVPLKETAKTKTKSKASKRVDEASDIVQPPISVVWESKENESTAQSEAIVTPKKRSRKSKATKENNLKSE